MLNKFTLKVELNVLILMIKFAFLNSKWKAWKQPLDQGRLHPLAGVDRKKNRQKFSESSDVNQIYTGSRVECADFDGQILIF